jgi:hypothetical protein
MLENVHYLKMLLLQDIIKMRMNAERFVAIDMPIKMHDHVQSYVAINLST